MNKDIEFIVVLPYTDKRVKFQLDGYEETYSKKIEDMIKYINSYVPYKINILNDLLWTFRPFLVDIENQTIEELEENIEEKKTKRVKELERISKEHELQAQRDLLNNSDIKKVSHISNVTNYWKR